MWVRATHRSSTRVSKEVTTTLDMGEVAKYEKEHKGNGMSRRKGGQAGRGRANLPEQCDERRREGESERASKVSQFASTNLRDSKA